MNEKVKILGNIYDENFGSSFGGNVYDKEHLSPTINTMQGGGRESMILEDANEKYKKESKVYIPYEGAICYPLRSREFWQYGFQEICPTLCARDWKDPKCVIERSKMEEQMIVAMRGRNPENPSDRTSGIETEQRLEPQQEGICNTSSQLPNGSYNYLMDETETITTKGEKIDVARTILNGYHRTNMTGYNGDNGVCERDSSHNYRIRKLTPKECWRLMGFSDEQFDKAAEVNSSTQLYKQAGNSIVVDVLVEIFKELILSLEGKSPRYKEDEQISLFDFM